MTRHRIAQIGENRNPKSPENRPQTRRFLQIRLLQLRRSATPFSGLAVLHGRLNSVRPLVALTDARRMPVIFPDISFVEAGGLMSYGPDFQEIHRRTAEIIAKILTGTPPGDIPVEQPTKFVFGINSKTANSLGLALPAAALMRADVVIE